MFWEGLFPFLLNQKCLKPLYSLDETAIWYSTLKLPLILLN